MIVKSLSRTTPSFGQLLDYFYRDGTDHDGVNTTFQHNLLGSDHAAIVQEFEQNYTYLPARKNGTSLRHDVLVLPSDRLPESDARVALLDLAHAYVTQRYPNQMVFGRVHMTQNEYPHIHLMVSSNAVRSHQRAWVSKREFLDTLAQLEAYKCQHYPELQEQFYSPKARQKQQSSPTQVAPKNHREQQAAIRTSKPSQKQQVHQLLRDTLATAKSFRDFEAALLRQGFLLYCRGNTWGVKNQSTEKKYRLKTLNLMDAFEKHKTAWDRLLERQLSLSAARELTSRHLGDFERE